MITLGRRPGGPASSKLIKNPDRIGLRHLSEALSSVDPPLRPPATRNCASDQPRNVGMVPPLGRSKPSVGPIPE